MQPRTFGACLAAGIVLLSPVVTRAQSAPADGARPQERPVFVMDEHPSLRLGDAVRIEFTSLVDFNWRASDGDGEGLELGRRRAGIGGRLFDGAVGFEIERELDDVESPWRDVFAEWRRYRAVRVRAGRFKIPLGEERLTPVASLDLAQRSTISESLTPGRDTGVQVSGRLFGRGVGWDLGVFRHDGDVAREGTEAPGGRTAAARVAVAPFAWSAVRLLRALDVAVAATAGRVPEGRNSWRVRTASGYEAFEPVYVAGGRQRLSVGASLAHGRFALRGELLRARDERARQGLSGDDLPDLVGRGWLAGGNALLIGGLKDGGRAPRTPLFGGGVGALQFAGRLERLRLGSDAGWDDPFRNPRAANVMPNDLLSWTAGLNWLPVRFVKLQVNLVRERLDDPERRPDPSRAWTTTRVFRVQFSL